MRTKFVQRSQSTKFFNRKFYFELIFLLEYYSKYTSLLDESDLFVNVFNNI